MKKKNYLHKAEQGVILGASLLLLNSVAGCSLEPMDTPPTEPILTKGPTGLPGGLPGQSITYYPAGQSPTINIANKKYGFLMDYGYLKFETTIPWRNNSIIIKMNEDSTGYAKKVTKVEIYGHHWINWFTRGNDLIITDIKARFKDDTQIKRDEFPPETVYIMVYVTDENPIVLSFLYTI